MVNVLPQLLSFCVHEDIASVGPRWKQWLKRFEMFLANHDMKDATRKRALLLYSAGEEVSDIFEALSDQGEEKDYAKAAAAFNEVQQKVNKTYEIYMFRNATQSSGETLDSYCTRVRRLGQTCKFDHKVEEILVAHSQVLLTFTITARCSPGRHKSQRITRLGKAN